MNTSTVVAAKKKLLELLRVRFGYTPEGYPNPAQPVQVEYTEPLEIAHDERLFFGDVRDGEHEIRNMKLGRKERDEDYTLILWIEVADEAADTPETVETRALEILTEVEDLLADTPRLDETIAGLDATAGGFALRSDPLESGWLTTLQFRIDVEAILS